jgi:hypothetical protein
MHVVLKFLQVLSLPNLIFAFSIENISLVVSVCKVTGRSRKLPLVHLLLGILGYNLFLLNPFWFVFLISHHALLYSVTAQSVPIANPQEMY